MRWLAAVSGQVDTVPEQLRECQPGRGGELVPAPRIGQWQVATETSLYLIDIDRRLVTRVPDAGDGTMPGLPPVAIASLRRDHEPLPLIELVECELGKPLRMLIDVRRDGVPTLRVSTHIRELRQLNPPTERAHDDNSASPRDA
jgi:hypothetical protein